MAIQQGNVVRYIGPAAASGKLASKVSKVCTVKAISEVAGFVLASIQFTGDPVVYNTTGDKLAAV